MAWLRVLTIDTQTHHDGLPRGLVAADAVRLAGYLERTSGRYVALPTRCPACSVQHIGCGELVEHGALPPYTIEAPRWRCLECGWSWGVD